MSGEWYYTEEGYVSMVDCECGMYAMHQGVKNATEFKHYIVRECVYLCYECLKTYNVREVCYLENDDMDKTVVLQKKSHSEFRIEESLRKQDESDALVEAWREHTSDGTFTIDAGTSSEEIVSRTASTCIGDGIYRLKYNPYAKDKKEEREKYTLQRAKEYVIECEERAIIDKELERWINKGGTEYSFLKKEMRRFKALMTRSNIDKVGGYILERCEGMDGTVKVILRLSRGDDV